MNNLQEHSDLKPCEQRNCQPAWHPDSLARGRESIELHLNNIVISTLYAHLVEGCLVGGAGSRNFSRCAEDVAFEIGIKPLKRFTMLGLQKAEGFSVFFFIRQNAGQPKPYKILQLIFLAFIKRPL